MLPTRHPKAQMSTFVSHGPRRMTSGGRSNLGMISWITIYELSCETSISVRWIVLRGGWQYLPLPKSVKRNLLRSASSGCDSKIGCETATWTSHSQLFSGGCRRGGSSQIRASISGEAYEGGDAMILSRFRSEISI